MLKINQIYKCEICGNVVDVLRGRNGVLVCCGKDMVLEKVKMKDEGEEKHLPVVEKMPEDVCRGSDGWIVNIGEVEHPMEKEHFIEWIEIVTQDNKIGKKFLKPGDKPYVEFQTRSKVEKIRAYCNVHGLWELRM